MHEGTDRPFSSPLPRPTQPIGPQITASASHPLTNTSLRTTYPLMAQSMLHKNSLHMMCARRILSSTSSTSTIHQGSRRASMHETLSHYPTPHLQYDCIPTPPAASCDPVRTAPRTGKASWRPILRCLDSAEQPSLFCGCQRKNR